MRLLLDTHAVIWYIEKNPSLSATASAAIKNAENEIFVSIASIWEMSIKVSLDKLKLPKTIREIIAELKESGVTLIQISEEHALAVQYLPWHHRDPFDRMIITQAKQGGYALVTRDEAFIQYSVPRIW